MTRHLVLSGGPNHEFAAVAAELTALLAERGFESVVVDEPSDAVARLRSARAGREPSISLLTVHALHWRMDVPRYAHLRGRMARSLTADDAAELDAFVRRGGGLLALHTAVICFDADPAWRELCGAAWDWSTSSHPPLGPVAVALTAAGREHPVTAGHGDFVVTDECYEALDTVQGLEPLLVGRTAASSWPLLWAREVGAGRVVTDLLGHGPESLRHPIHRSILSRAAAWAAAALPAATRGRDHG
jgi:type 1 glutamine amidotransferase